VLLDLVVQSTLRGDAAYHEALVHPALMAHPNPRRVAIIGTYNSWMGTLKWAHQLPTLFTGGGEGATLREVLRHDTVKRAVMVEIDERMVNASRSYLPEWSDCRNIVGSAPSCFNDIRAEIYYEDAIAWFIHRYGDNADETFENEDGFDVIIMDAL
jgi:spermidine synthase